MQKQLSVSIFVSSVGFTSVCVQNSQGGEIVLGGKDPKAEFSARLADGSMTTINLPQLDAWGRAAAQDLKAQGIVGPLFIDPLTSGVHRIQ